jgi:molecular chaperone DnaJ
MLARDHYSALGVSREATADEIESAYRHLCRRYHPDVNPGEAHAAIVYARIERAYRVLSDPEARAEYDRAGADDAGAGERPPDTGRATRGARVQRGVDLPGDARGDETWRGFFRALTDHRRRSRPERGRDVEVSVVVPLWQAERGKRARVDVRRRVACAGCRGSGRVERGRRQACERCSGSGVEVFSRGTLAFRSACADCGGDGVVHGVSCPDCGGDGRQMAHESLVVSVPPGVRDGDAVRVRGAGDVGVRGGEPGDLLATCVVEEVPGVTRHGPHLEQTVPISVAEALLGARIEIETPLGERASLRVPPCADTGRRARIRGHGLAMPGGRRGDLVVRFEVRVPEILDEDSRELVRRYAARNPGTPRDGSRENRR